MSKLAELIQELCPDGVEYKKIGDIAIESKEKNKNREFSEVRTVTNESKLVRTSDYFDRNITSEDTSGYMVVRENMFVYNPSRINIGSIAYSTETSPVILSPMYVVFSVPQNILLNKFLLLYLKSGIGMHKIQSKVEPGARFRLPFNSLAKITIPVPPLEIQQEIVRILDSFTELTAELTTELTARKQQYEYYRDKLLSFNDISVIDYRPFGEVCDLKAGKAISSNEISEEQTTTYPIPCYGGNGLRGFVRMPNQQGEHSLIGRQGALCGNVCFVEGAFYATEHAVVVTDRGFFNSRFLFHVLVQKKLNQYKTAGAQPGLSVAKLESIYIPVPDMSIQNRIANILDGFDSICNSFSSGLPAEIEARQKQYEYYRDKLLTFKEKMA